MRLKLSASSFFTFFLGVLFAGTSLGNPSHQPSASEILHRLQKLNVLGSVLYFAAHPDDENTGFIAYMANEKQYETFYLSLTRGDGGQNLIGPEMRELLGMIRTQELLQARKVDGGKQFFSRANDFGYSKNPEEALRIWNRDAVLADAVWIIRKTRPDIIITRFPPDERAGHGHHTASAMLAAEAFDAAGDPTKFPEQLKYAEVWQPRRLMWNISPWSVRNREEYVKAVQGYIKVDIGKYNPLLGVSYGEMAAKSRSMHKSQGFGSVGARGIDVEYFEHVKGEKASSDLMDGVSATWARVKGAEDIPAMVSSLITEFSPINPAASIEKLVALRKRISRLEDGYWKQVKLKEVDGLIKDVLGLYLEAVAETPTLIPGQPVNVRVEAINRSSYPVDLVSWEAPFTGRDTLINQRLKDNAAYKTGFLSVVPADQEISHPYWLTKDIGYDGLFEVKDQTLIGQPENTPPARIKFRLSLGGELVEYELPVVFKKRDPVRGEVYEPVHVSPPVYAAVENEVYMFRDQQARTVKVTVTSARDEVSGKVRLNLPEGWKVAPASSPFSIAKKGGMEEVTFRVTAPAQPGVANLTAVVETADGTYDRGLGVISYEHIPRQVYFPKSAAKAVKLDLQTKGKRIGYIHGAGDAVPAALQEVGYEVTILEDKDLDSKSLSAFDAVIVGVRAYNTRPALQSRQRILMEYVEKGGNLIVQYNTSMDLLLKELGPYPFDLTRDRVSVEDAEVRILNPQSPVLNEPNKISSKDFDGWVQERGLYFPQNWDSRYQTVISANDPGSPPLDGGIIYTKYGKGHYVYTSLSWFRELPAGVPGAYRLFVNLISLGK